MNSQPPRPRLSASQGAARTPTNFIQKNKEMLARMAQQKHQATPMPANLRSQNSRHCSQPAPKLTKVTSEARNIAKPVLPPVHEDSTEFSQSVHKKTPGEVFLEKVHGQEVPASGTTYDDLARGRPLQASPTRPKPIDFKTPESGKAVFTPLAVARSRGSGLTPQRNGESVEAGRGVPPHDHPPTAAATAPTPPITPQNPPASTPQKPQQVVIPPHVGTPITRIPDDKPPFTGDSGWASPKLTLYQTYATSRKSLLASQAALQGTPVPVATTPVQPAVLEERKSTPSWNVVDAQPVEVKTEEKPAEDQLQMEEIRLFGPEKDSAPMQIEENFPPAKPVEQRESLPQAGLAATRDSGLAAEPQSLTLGRKETATPASTPVPTPKSILKKAMQGGNGEPLKAVGSPQKEGEGSNTEASDSELLSKPVEETHSDGEVRSSLNTYMSSPVQKRKRFNAALLTPFDVPLEALSDCDILYNAEIKAYSAKRRKRSKAQ